MSRNEEKLDSRGEGKRKGERREKIEERRDGKTKE